MFRLILRIIGLFFIGLIVLGFYNNSLSVILNNLGESDNPKKIILAIDYAGIIPAGDSVIENKGVVKFNDKEALLITAVAKPNPVIYYFYNLKAQAQSIMDKDTLASFQFKHKLNKTGGDNEEKTVNYDQLNHVMTTNNDKRVILPETYDVLSAIFKLINQDLEVGKDFDMNINTNQKNYNLLVKVTQRRQMKVKDKLYEFYLMKGQVKRRDKSMRNYSQFDIWILDKPFRTILTARIFTNIGLITVRKAK